MALIRAPGKLIRADIVSGALRPCDTIFVDGDHRFGNPGIPAWRCRLEMEVHAVRQEQWVGGYPMRRVPTRRAAGKRRSSARGKDIVVVDLRRRGRSPSGIIDADTRRTSDVDDVVFDLAQDVQGGETNAPRDGSGVVDGVIVNQEFASLRRILKEHAGDRAGTSIYDVIEDGVGLGTGRVRVA